MKNHYDLHEEKTKLHNLLETQAMQECASRDVHMHTHELLTHVAHVVCAMAEKMKD